MVELYGLYRGLICLGIVAQGHRGFFENLCLQLHCNQMGARYTVKPLSVMSANRILRTQPLGVLVR